MKSEIISAPTHKIAHYAARPGHPPVPGSLRHTVRSPVRTGYAIILVFIFGFGLWAGFAPLAGGAVASGVLSPSSSRRIVQHLEGGIIRELKVRDGAEVKAGDPLVVLEPVQPQSAHDALLADLRALEARKVRLEAERTLATAIAFPPSLLVDGRLDPVAQSQLEIFEARRSAHVARRSVLEKRTEQLNADIKGLRVQMTNVDQQIALINEEVEGKEKLLAQGLMPKPEALRLRRAQSELAARRSEFESAVAKTEQQIAENALQIASAEAARLDDVTAEVDKISSEIADTANRLRASADVLNRTTITAPVDGTVINLRFKTIGGVVQRGEPVLDIVPKDDTLIIEARVNPNDIRLVHPGQEAQVHLAAYSFRVLPRIKGIVRSASADRVTDANGHQNYFLAKVEIDRKDLDAHAPGLTLVSGMTADVIFVTEKRTMLQYLLSPMTDVMWSGMKEL